MFTTSSLRTICEVYTWVIRIRMATEYYRVNINELTLTQEP